MKTTRRQFLKLAGCVAIAAAAGRATPGMQVEEPQVSDPAKWAALGGFEWIESTAFEEHEIAIGVDWAAPEGSLTVGHWYFMQHDLEYQQFDKIVATFQPQRTDDLKPGVADWIGYRGIMWALWIIEEGPYAGQWAFGPALEEVEKPDYVPVPWGWMPEDDMADVKRYDRNAGEE